MEGPVILLLIMLDALLGAFALMYYVKADDLGQDLGKMTRERNFWRGRALLLDREIDTFVAAERARAKRAN